MKRLTIALSLSIVVLLGGCATETVYYTPAYKTYYKPVYKTRTVYSVGYYGAPYWNNAYYYGYDDIQNVGYWGMYDAYTVY
ncbi:MAG: hypothetical protein BGO90_12175 [Legionella sp. 40-6]|nr:hypothetical protein [Legionella sp.]OJY54813.1 MAG: hypothetical protein BGO90_12175 [Legionella sp. 40-6]